MIKQKPRLAVYKFTSCDGCQLALLNAGQGLLRLSEMVDIVHFAEAGFVDDLASVDIVLIEGSVSTPHEAQRIQLIRERSRFLITIGACATSGGIQALRNGQDHADWIQAIYATPAHIQSLATSTPISRHVAVDFEIWGCPVSSEQVLNALHSVWAGAKPIDEPDAVCVECKQQGYDCVMVTQQIPCLGPVTRRGCHALCPGLNRGCYGCYGPKDIANSKSLGQAFLRQGVAAETIARQFLSIHSQTPAFQQAGQYFKGIPIVKQ